MHSSGLCYRLSDYIHTLSQGELVPSNSLKQPISNEIKPVNAVDAFLEEFDGKPKEFYEDRGVKVYREQLDNGLKVLLVQKRFSPFAYIDLVTPGGSRFDPMDKRGLAHFAEHMALAGARDYPTTEAIFDVIGKEGGSLNARTSDDTMTINASVCDPGDVPLAMHVISQCITDSLYYDQKIASEKEAIYLEKLKPSTVFTNAYRKLFYHGSSYAHPVHESVEQITREDIIEHNQELLVGKNMILMITGDVPFEDVMHLAKKEFGPITAGKSYQGKELPSPPAERDSVVFVDTNHKDKQISFTIGFRTVPSWHIDTAALTSISIKLGVGATSKLMSNLRWNQKKALVYGVGTEIDNGHLNVGALLVNGRTSKEHINNVFKAVLGTLAKTRNSGLDPTELDSNKHILFKGIKAGFEASERWRNMHLGYLAREMYPSLGLRGQFSYPVYDVLSRFANVTQQDTQRVAQKYFKGIRAIVNGNMDNKSMDNIREQLAAFDA